MAWRLRVVFEPMVTLLPCGQPKCRAYHLTVSEFERLGGETWTQSFRVRLGLLARKLYAEIYRKKPEKVRSSTKPEWRNKVGKYPCGILEQAYRQLKGKEAVAMHPLEAHNTRKGQTTRFTPH
jgi:hypothetical protein